VEKGTARTTNLRCLSPSLLSQTVEPSEYQTRVRYGEKAARDAIVQYFPDGESFAEISRAGEGHGAMLSGMVWHLLRANEVGQVSCEDLGD
jgi:hypothetical protein